MLGMRAIPTTRTTRPMMSASSSTSRQTGRGPTTTTICASIRTRATGLDGSEFGGADTVPTPAMARAPCDTPISPFSAGIFGPSYSVFQTAASDTIEVCEGDSGGPDIKVAGLELVAGVNSKYRLRLPIARSLLAESGITMYHARINWTVSSWICPADRELLRALEREWLRLPEVLRDFRSSMMLPRKGRSRPRHRNRRRDHLGPIVCP